jgi:anaerobic ribonucleoside-triphosphate reductase activating protein
VICFSGYTLQRLQRRPPNRGVPALLELLDVLIDGDYRSEQDDQLGLRGSSNQHIHHFSNRLQGENLTTLPRRVELHVLDGELQLVGVPPHGVARALDNLDLSLLSSLSGGSHERSQTRDCLDC